MQWKAPTPAEVQSALQALTRRQLTLLSERSGAHFGTLMKIRSGDTREASLSTVNAITPHIKQVARIKR